MVDILNLALSYFGLIFIGFACGKTRGLPESGLAWMNFFLLYVSLPALLFRIMSETPFSELNNPPFLIATTLATVSAFVLAMVAGRIIGELSLRKATMAGLAGAPTAISAIWARDWRWRCSAPRRQRRPR
jgi:malonate transporter